MAWTKERIDLLIGLWMSGKSANAVAKEIGNVSRNAVIGKVHRLGISNRINLKKTAQVTKKENEQSRLKNNKNTSLSYQKSMANYSETYKEHSSKLGKLPLKPSYPPRGHGKNNVLSRDPSAALQFKKLSLYELKENTCRWPSGDPKDNNFHFCGCPTESNTPYCAYHAKIAYAQTSKRDTKKYIVVEPKPRHTNEEFNDTISIDMPSIQNDNSENMHYI
jgi:GcrA cell cycle regulator